jgi:hypothetical protein
MGWDTSTEEEKESPVFDLLDACNHSSFSPSNDSSPLPSSSSNSNSSLSSKGLNMGSLMSLDGLTCFWTPLTREAEEAGSFRQRSVEASEEAGSFNAIEEAGLFKAIEEAGLFSRQLVGGIEEAGLFSWDGR